MVKHIILWTLNPELSAEEKAEIKKGIKEGLEGLLGQVPGLENAIKIVIKEIRFGPNTDEHDFQFKLKHAQEFLGEGSKVKASVFFRGRSIQFADQGEKLLLRFAVELEEYGRAENMPQLEGKRMIMMIAPVKKK